MKKVLFSVVAIVAFAMSANAQLFIGGSLSATTSSTKNCFNSDILDDTKEVNSGLEFGPKIGYQLSDKFAVGGVIELSTTKTTPDKEADKKVWTKENSWAVAPFVRYTFISFGNFNVKGEAKAGFGMSTPKYNDGSDKTKGDKTTTLALSVAPLLSYSISDHFDLETSLNFLSLSLTHEVTKDQNDKDVKTIENECGFSASSYNVKNTGYMTIGFIYKF